MLVSKSSRAVAPFFIRSFDHEARSLLLASRLDFQSQSLRLQECLDHVIGAGSVVVQIDAVACVGLDVYCEIA